MNQRLDIDRVFLLIMAGLFSVLPLLNIMPFRWPGNLIAIIVLLAIGALPIFFRGKFPQKIRESLVRPLTWTWVFSLLGGSFLLWFAMFFVAFAFPDYYWVEKLDTLQLEHGYSLTLYEDGDVESLLATLHGPGGVEYQRDPIGSIEHVGRHFVAGKTADGTLGWVTAASDHDQLLFFIDYRTGVFWNSEHWDVLYNGREAEYLKRINADGGNRRFQ